MALLEALPEVVENSLRELHAQNETARNGSASPNEPAEKNGAAAAPPTAELPPAPDTSEALTETPETDPEKAAEADRTIAFETDVTTSGAFGTEWVVVEKEQVCVLAPNGATKAHVRHVVPMTRIKEAKAEMHIGNGTLEVRTDTETIPLVRFSHATVAEAHAVARRITALAKGKEVPAEEIEATKKHCPRCKRVLPEDSQVCPACVNKRAVMLRLFQFLSPFKRQAIASVVVLLGITALELAPPQIGGLIVDALTPKQGGAFSPAQQSDGMKTLIGLVALLALLRLFVSGLQYVQRRLNAWLGARILMDIRVSLFHKFNLLSLGYYDKRSIGSVMSRITNDSDQLWDFLTDGIPWFVSNILTLILIGIVLFHKNWQLAILLLAPAPFIYLLTAWFMPRAHKKWHFVWQRISKMYSSLNSTLNGMRVVKAFAQEDREDERFRQRNHQVFQASFAANGMWAVYWPVMSVLMALGYYIIWLMGGYKILHGQDRMTVGDLTAFIGYLGQFYAPFMNFSRVMDWSTRSMTAAERVFEVLDTEPDIAESKKPVPMPEMQGAVEFEDVSFTYDKGKRVLEDFTLKVEPGEMIGLVGHSGAGKSTLINLLARFYDVTEGTIKIDGVDIRQIKQEDFRRQLGIVLQEPFLFPGTIRDNIAYARPDASTDDILRAAKAANCHEFILKFADGYDTQVGDRGHRLSGGERQRISIARAILHNPKILILDEATASVDTETEKQIQEAISNLIKNRTTFAIAHRLSTLRNASRLVVMKEGKMVECGTHDELMEEDGTYARLVNIQNEVNKIRAI